MARLCGILTTLLAHTGSTCTGDIHKNTYYLSYGWLQISESGMRNVHESQFQPYAKGLVTQHERTVFWHFSMSSYIP